ncbi:anthrax toxin-like adenylyl cyclase domain-containing protein [Fangia hongkongensis]|uniref:anthrax toxin-like adenylyl cyclase domain-containing protein n=1 Tax=Fangia hongkongensis TaxID=270495 RepID=UPI0003704014|nr:anthrax toxin-like adenylyl cyclase domain-containing protein [Fangia hongkongensis]
MYEQEAKESILQYRQTAGFPAVHIGCFKTYCREKKIALVSRELNPLCTDLMLEGYAAKGFHIKAKTCDWGPMAGFVPLDYRFTKQTQSIDKQQKVIEGYLKEYQEAKSLFIPLELSIERVQSLAKMEIIRLPYTDLRLMECQH